MTLGAAPPDFSGPVGQFRLLANDTTFTNAANGIGTFSLFGDDEIEGYLAVSPTSLLRAVGYGYMGLASRAAMESKVVKDYDLSADLTKRAADLRSAARTYFDRADAEASLAGTDSVFEISEKPRDHHRNVLEPTGLDTLGWGQF